MVVRGSPAIRMYPNWGVTALEPGEVAQLRSYVMGVPDIDLEDELAAEAKDAAEAQDFRRAVLFLAVAAEVAVKRRLFEPASIAGDAFEYLEDRGRIRVGVPDLIKAAGQALGTRFEEANPSGASAVMALFACRNRVVHHGDTVYRDTAGRLLKPDHLVLRNWWEAVASLREWLSTSRKVTPAGEPDGV